MEEWKYIKEFEDYQISNFGRVKSLKRNKEIIFKQIICKTNGYLMVQLCSNGKHKGFTVHTLVWDHFGDKPRNGRKLQVDHINNDRFNNRIDNLQLLSHRANSSKQNIIKTSKYPGVYWDKNAKKWHTAISINNYPKYLGLYSDELEAKKAYEYELSRLQ